jgi:hypothetical protein
MGREVRKVTPNWEHPKDEKGRFIPLNQGYEKRAREFLDRANAEGLQAAIEYQNCPNKDDYMPDWTAEEATHFMMYEDCSEGTPISPAFETPEKLARWLSATGASSFGTMTATYEGWLRVANGGYAISAVYSPSVGFISGVDAG